MLGGRKRKQKDQARDTFARIMETINLIYEVVEDKRIDPEIRQEYNDKFKQIYNGQEIGGGKQ